MATHKKQAQGISAPSLLSYCYFIFLVVFLCFIEIGFLVCIKHITISIQRCCDIRVAENVLQYFRRHSAFNASCCIGVSELMLIAFRLVCYAIRSELNISITSVQKTE